MLRDDSSLFPSFSWADRRMALGQCSSGVSPNGPEQRSSQELIDLWVEGKFQAILGKFTEQKEAILLPSHTC